MKTLVYTCTIHEHFAELTLELEDDIYFTFHFHSSSLTSRHSIAEGCIRESHCVNQIEFTFIPFVRVSSR